MNYVSPMHMWYLRLIFLLSFWMSGCSVCPNYQQLGEDRERFACTDLNILYTAPELPECLTLEDMIEIALQRNLELAIKEQRYAIQTYNVQRTGFTMLPELTYSLSYNNRNNNTAAWSVSTDPNILPSTPSIGLEREIRRASVTFLWDLLDFGVSYFRTKQECDLAFIDHYEYQRTAQDLILRVVQLYWRAVIAKRAVEIATPIVEEIVYLREMLKDEITHEVYLDKAKSLSKLGRYYLREIQLKGYNDRTDSSDPTQGYEKEYMSAILNLRQLLRLPPDYPLEICGFESFPETAIDFFDQCQLDKLAMHYRPELYQDDLREQIAYEDVHIAFIKQFPSLSLFFGYDYDSNKFLVHKEWYSVGARVAQDLLSLPQHWTSMKIGYLTADFVRLNRLQTAIGILTQIRLALILYDQNKDQFLLAQEYASNNRQVAEISQKLYRCGMASREDALNTRIDASLAEINALKIYAELQTSVEQVNNAIGIPRFFQIGENENFGD